MAIQTSLTVADWHRLNRLLEQGLEIEGSNRAAWLDALGAEDQHLRAVLIDLLAQSDATGFATGATHAPTAVARLAAEALATMRHEQPGDRIGPWQLERLLAEGGMGAVWVAQRADGVMKRTAALKLPRAEWIDRGLTERIARERAILARLQHPAIAVLYDAGVTDSGRPYLALEYVDGVAIDVYCKGRDLKEIHRLYVQVVRAVAYAHGQLVIHRDLKPANVLVTADGTPKLLDFGISKLIEGDAPAVDQTALTRLAGRPLTLAYAAPEQVLGLPITVGADVYALGVMLFELAAGSRPYRATEPRTLEAEVLRGDLRKPSEVAKEKSRVKALRGDLDAVILKSLKREPNERYQSAAALADDIERYLNGHPVQARPDSRAYRLRKFVRRNTLPVAAASAIVIALGLGLGVALWQANTARTEARRATLIKDFVLSIIQQADPVASRQTKEADIALLTTAESRIERELERRPELALQMRRAIGEAYLNRGEYRRAREVLRKAIAQARITLPPKNLELIGAMVQMADEYVVDSREARADLETAITHLRTLGPAAQPLLADALTARHRTMRWASDWKEAVASAREAYRVARASGDEGRVLVAAADLGYVLIGPPVDEKELLPAIAEAWDFGTRSGRIEPADPRRIIAMAWYGYSLCRAGQQAEGLKLGQQAVDDARKYHGSISRAAEHALGTLGFTFGLCLDDSKRALEPVREAYAIVVKREPPESENRSFRMSMLTNVLFDLELHDEVRQILRETPVEAQKGSGSPTATPVHNLTYLASVHLRLGDAETALQLADEALVAMQAAESLLFMGDWVYGVLAQALLENGRPERAETIAVAALEQPEWAGGRAWQLLRLGRIRLVLGKYQSALELADQALALYSETGAPGAGQLSQVNYQRGRALLGLGRHQDAVEALSASYDHEHKFEPGSTGEARLAYWYGQALIAIGEPARGRALVAAASPRLAASKNQLDRALVAGDGNPAKSR